MTLLCHQLNCIILLTTDYQCFTYKYNDYSRTDAKTSKNGLRGVPERVLAICECYKSVVKHAINNNNQANNYNKMPPLCHQVCHHVKL